MLHADFRLSSIGVFYVKSLKNNTRTVIKAIRYSICKMQYK